MCSVTVQRNHKWKCIWIYGLINPAGEYLQGSLTEPVNRIGSTMLDLDAKHGLAGNRVIAQ